MRWEDERYVRVYTRDTVDWQVLSFEAQALLVLILRKVDRAGILPLGRQGRKAVAVAIGHPKEWERLEPALIELEQDGCIVVEGEHLLVRNFIEAQETPQSDAARQRAHREGARAKIQSGTASVTKRDTSSQNVTESHAVSRAVTGGHAESRAVTPNHAVPSVPNQTNQPARDGWLLALRRGLQQLHTGAWPLAAEEAEHAAVEAELCTAVTAVGVEAAIATCLAMARAKKKRDGKWPTTLRYFASGLTRDAEKRSEHDPTLADWTVNETELARRQQEAADRELATQSGAQRAF